MATALLISRLIVGLGMAVHGAQKLFGWFDGHGLNGTGGFFGVLGFRPGRTFALLAGAAEFGSGLLIAFGLLGPIGPALLIAVMIVAIFAVHWKNGFLVAKNGYELPLLYSGSALALAFAGPGPYSLDAALGLAGRWTPNATWLLIVAAVVVAVANLVARRPQAAPSSTSAQSPSA